MVVFKMVSINKHYLLVILRRRGRGENRKNEKKVLTVHLSLNVLDYLSSVFAYNSPLSTFSMQCLT